MSCSNKFQVEEIIICVICKNPYTDPCLLPCSHSYCRKCIEEIASTNEDQFQCPLHDECKILKNDIDSLPTNQSICGLIELYDSIQFSNLCTNCQSVAAEYLCDTCKNEKFCSECYEKEHTSRIMQKHQRLSMDEKLPEMIPCNTHKDEKLKYWCRRCNELICRDCLLFEHKDHTSALINDVVKEFEKKINIHLQAIQSSLKYRINRAEILINAVDDDSRSSRLNIVEMMESLRRTIDEHERTMLEKVSMIEKEQKKQLEDYKTPLQNHLQNLDIRKATFEMLLSSKNHTRLLQTRHEFDDYVQKTNATLNSLPMPTRIEYGLKGGDQLEILKEQIVQCGRYVEEPPYHNPQLEKLIADNQTNAELDLNGRELTDLDMKIVADVLRTNTTLTTLHLERNQIEPQGAQHLADALRINKTLTTFYIRENQIGYQGAQHIAEALKINNTLTILGLSQNQITQQGAQHIADALKINQTLTTLYLYKDQLGQQGVQYIADALKSNQTLTTLAIGNNGIDQEGAQSIADALKNNQTLATLSIFQNQIRQQGAQYIADAPKINQTLTTLYLNETQIDQQAIHLFREALRTKTGLTVYW